MQDQKNKSKQQQHKRNRDDSWDKLDNPKNPLEHWPGSPETGTVWEQKITSAMKQYELIDRNEKDGLIDVCAWQITIHMLTLHLSWIIHSLWPQNRGIDYFLSSIISNLTIWDHLIRGLKMRNRPLTSVLKKITSRTAEVTVLAMNLAISKGLV